MQVELPFHSKSHRVEKLNPFKVGFRRSLKISVIIAHMPLKTPVIIARTPQEEESTTLGFLLILHHTVRKRNGF